MPSTSAAGRVRVTTSLNHLGQEVGPGATEQQAGGQAEASGGRDQRNGHRVPELHHDPRRPVQRIGPGVDPALHAELPSRDVLVLDGKGAEHEQDHGADDELHLEARALH